MPLKDLLSKAPSPLPPSEEPWPRPDVSNNYKQSPLYSTIARPTLDEFLRTNYLMIPDFVLQVNQAKIAAWMGRSGQDVPNTASQQSMANLGGPAVTSSVGNRVVYNNSNDKEFTMIENGEIKEKDSKTTTEIPNTKRGDNLFTVVSQKRLSCDEIPPPLKPKPRVKKVMKGGSLVIIPAPQPRNRALQATSSPGPSPLSRWRVGANNSSHHHFERREDSGDEVALQVSAEDGSKNMLPVIKSINGKDGEHMFDMPERSHVYKETVTCDSEQLAKKDDTTIPCQGANDLHKEVSTRDDKRLGSGVPTAECEQKQVTLPVCRTDISLNSKPTTDENSNNSSNDPGSTACTRPLSVADKSIVLHTSHNSEMIINKDSDRVSNKCLQGEFPGDSKRDLTGKVLIEEEKELLKEDPNPIENIGEHLSKDDVRTPPIVDHKEVKTSLATVGDTAAGLGPQGSISVVTQLVATESSKIKKSSTDLSHDLAMKSSYTMQSSVDNEDGQSAEEPSTDMNSDRTSHEKHLADKEEKHIEVIDDGDRDINCSVDAQNAHGTNADDLKDVDLHGCDTAVVDDNDNTNSDNESSTSTDDVDEDDDDDVVGSKDNSSDDSNEEYAELVMEDSNSEEEEEEDDIFPVGENDSDDEEEGEVKSDYEAEDMNLDSDTEAATGGITFYQDTTIGQRVKNSRSRQGEKQPTRKKNKKKKRKASKKRAKAEKQAAKVSNRNRDPTSGQKNNEGKQKHMPESHIKKSVNEESRIRVPVLGHKSSGTFPKPAAQTLPQNNPPKESTLQGGSLLSMVSSCPVDLTVAASEKLLKNKSRGGQHAKKFKKAKRKAEAIERIRRGDPPPRHVPKKRVFVELPKPICAFYMEGKCRKGSDCSFRHDRSALIKRKEVCRFYMFSKDNCFAGDDCIYMHSSFPCKFFHTSRCWEGDRCKFSHDALTEETGQLLRAFLNPPTEDPVQLSQEKKLATSGQQAGCGNTRVEDTLQTATASSPYNLRASTRKRTLSTDGEGTGGKISRQENPGKDQEDAAQANNEGQRCAFLPGLYRDLSK